MKIEPFSIILSHEDGIVEAAHVDHQFVTFISTYHGCGDSNYCVGIDDILKLADEIRARAK